ncbi:MAG: 16S rRNA (adenine(1518)-N(6)/adenine(1519)-N(6))-dimethyltransferase RsmA, partial [Candidatus Omnitrophota bacterium]|nr:16S rRNA (adenine(1518)-N(6)/adenine(1519)-N(6))-dimethyltransferase RsmA [Candidatus Omnitrophota bacterium]
PPACHQAGPMLTAAALKTFLRTHDVRLRKRLGQHHLVDARLVQRLVDRFNLSPRDTVVEIGAGLGALTEPMAERVARVIAVDVDRKICALLRERLAQYSNVTVVCEDILEFSWKAHEGSMVVGAIPYHITSTILVALSEHRRVIREAWLILQEEVARRLTASPGTKAYSRLSVLGQYGWDIERVMAIPRSAFFPQPEVDSACLHFRPRLRPAVAVEDELLLFEVVKAAFAHRRKTLVNCLSAHTPRLMSRGQAEALLREVGLPVAVRGEQLSLNEFASLANALGRLNPLR